MSFVQTDTKFVSDLRIQAAMESIQRGDAISALVEMENLLDKEPTHPEALFLVGQAYLFMGNPLSALQALEKCILLAPNEPEVHISLSIAAFDASRFQLALSAAKFAISLEQTSSLAWRYKGLSLERIGHLSTAERALLRAFELDPENNPLPSVLTEDEWDDIVKKSFKQLPTRLQVFYNSLDVLLQLFPTEEQLQSQYPPLDPQTDLVLIDDPPKLILFTGNLRHNYPPQLPAQERIVNILIEEAERYMINHKG